MLMARGGGKKTLGMLLHLSRLRDFRKILVCKDDSVIKTGAMAKIVPDTLWERGGVTKSVLNDSQHRLLISDVTNVVVNIGA